MDMSAIARALAKIITYKAYGKQTDAEQCARELILLLECADILAVCSVRPAKREQQTALDLD